MPDGGWPESLVVEVCDGAVSQRRLRWGEMASAKVELSKGLRRRHMNLIALGGVIGAGLFVGSATNLLSAKSFGEFEYWFSSIKVVAIVVFLALGLLWITGLWPESTPGLSNLVDHGGFAPLGWGAVLAAAVPCVAFYTGAEIVTVAAAESSEPERAVARAMKSIVLRTIGFYVGSIPVVATVIPWDAESRV